MNKFQIERLMPAHQGLGVWVGRPFEDLSDGDRFRYTHKRWVEYTVVGAPWMNERFETMTIDIDDAKTVTRYTWARLWAAFVKWLR